MSTPKIFVRTNQSMFQNWIVREPYRTDELLAAYKREGAALVTAILRRLIPLGETGFMRESVGSRETPFGFTVFVSAPYARFVDEGTKPHMIRPKKPEGVLRWIGAWGQPIFAKYVLHPGFKGRRFVDWTLREAYGRLEELAVRLWRQIHGR